MEKVDIFHPLARVVKKKCCKLPIAFHQPCHAVYHKGSLYVKSAPYVYGRDYRVYDYSTSEDTWDISPIKTFKALAVRNDQIVLIDTYREQEEEPELIRIYPFTSDGDINENENVTTLSVEASKPDSGRRRRYFLSAASDKNTLVIAYSNLKVLFDQSKTIEFAFPSLDTSTRSTRTCRDYYFRCLFYDDCLYLSPTSAESEHDNDRQWYYTQLPQNTEQTEHDKVLSPLDEDLSPPNQKKARLDKESTLDWEPMPQLPHDCSNLACFGRQLVTVRSSSLHRGIEIQAYSKITNSWVTVADNEDFDHKLGQYSSIFRLDDTGELMVIECGNNHRDVHKLSIEVKPYDPKSEVTLQALYKLEAGAGIQVLSKLGSKLREFRKKANIRQLYAYKYGNDCPVVDIYIKSWLEDSSTPPTWEKFLAILKEIGLQDVAERIHDFLSNTVPYPAITEQDEVRVEHKEEDEDSVSKSVISIDHIDLSDSHSTEGSDELTPTDNLTAGDNNKSDSKAPNSAVKNSDPNIKRIEEAVTNLSERMEKLENTDSVILGYFEQTAIVKMGQQRNQQIGNIPVFGDYPDGEHSRPVMRDLLHEIAPKAGDHWFDVGMQLGLPYEQVKKIKRDHTENEERFAALFHYWEQQGGTGDVRPYKWQSILQVLEYRLPVPLRKLANDIREKF